MQGGEHPGLAESVLELIGGTPIVKLKRLADGSEITTPRAEIVEAVQRLMAG